LGGEVTVQSDPGRGPNGAAKHGSIGARFGVSLDSSLQDRWFDLGTRASTAARGPNATQVNHSLAAEINADPQSPLVPVYLLWIADNLAREGRNADALDVYDRAIAAVGDSAPLAERYDVRRAVLKSMSGAFDRAGDPAGAIRTLVDLGDVRTDDPGPLYQAGYLAERSGRNDEARDLYLAAAGRAKPRRQHDPSELARRAAARLDEPSSAFRETPESLIDEVRSAIEDRDASRLAAVRSNTHFSVGAVGGESGFEGVDVAESLFSELATRPISVGGVLGSGGKRYLQTQGWKGSLFRGEVLLVLIRSGRGWQWTGIALADPTEEWMARWRPAKIETNQPLPFPLRAPWPAGQSFRAGGIRDFALKTAAIAAAGFIGGPILAYVFSRNDCGFGTPGYYYNTGPTHDEEDAFAIDFTRYKYGQPFNSIAEGTPVLAAADGNVIDFEDSVPSGEDPGYPNMVEVQHPDPVTGAPRFVSRYLHLAGPKLSVSYLMPVKAGNRLGLVDDTGYSYLQHLHFSIHDSQAPYTGYSYGASVRPSPMDGQTLGDGDSGKCIRSANIETEPPISVDDISNPSQFESQHYVHTETADGLHLYTLTGVVILHLKGTGRDWLRAQVNLGITVPEIPAGFGLKLKHWSPLVTLNAIQNDEVANWAGWAVDWFQVAHPASPITQQVTVETGVAVRDSDGYLLRLGYEVTLAGTFSDRPEEPEGPVFL
jgi:Peptidase family M23